MKIFLRRSRTFVPILILSLYVVVLSERRPSYDRYYRAQFGDMVYGTAWRPFVSRSFMPFLIRESHALIPQSVNAELLRILEIHPRLIGARTIGGGYLVERAIYLLLEWAALICFAYGLWRFMRSAGLVTQWSYVSALIVLGSVPAFFRYTNYIYDWTTLALFTWSLVFLEEERWPAYLLVLSLCLWNKETGILLCWIYLLLYWRKLKEGNRKHWMLFLGQSVLALTVLVMTRLIFADNPGTNLEWHFFDLERQFYIGYTLQSYVTLLALLFLILYRFRDQPRFLQKAITILPILIPLSVFFGNLDEYRDYYEALPIVGTMISVSFYGFYSRIELTRH